MADILELESRGPTTARWYFIIFLSHHSYSILASKTIQLLCILLYSNKLLSSRIRDLVQKLSTIVD